MFQNLIVESNFLKRKDDPLERIVGLSAYSTIRILTDYRLKTPIYFPRILT